MSAPANGASAARLAAPPVKPQSFPSIIEASRQQTELVVWMAEALQDHEERLEALAERLNSFYSARKQWRNESPLQTGSPLLAGGSQLALLAQGKTERPDGEVRDSPEVGEPGKDDPHKTEGSRRSSPHREEALTGGSSLRASPEQLLEAKLPEVAKAAMAGAAAGEIPAGDSNTDEGSVQLRPESVMKAAALAIEELATATENRIAESARVLQEQMESRLDDCVQFIHDKTQRQIDALADQRHDALRSATDEDATEQPPPESSAKREHAPVAEDVPMSEKSREASNAERAGSEQRAQVEDEQRSLRDTVADLSARLPIIEEDVGTLKPMRLKMSSLVSDVGELSEKVSFMTDTFNTIQSLGEQDEDEDAPPQPEVVERRRASLAVAYLSRRSLNSEDGGLEVRLSKLERNNVADASSRLNDMDTMMSILEDKLKGLDGDYRVSSGRVDTRLDLLAKDLEAIQEEGRNNYKTWNLANQVDVIQSLVNQEMRCVRGEVDNSLKISMGHFTRAMAAMAEKEWQKAILEIRRGSSRLSVQSGQESSKNKGTVGREDASTEADLEYNYALLEDKFKKLQECYQQAQLKIAGLKAVAKRHETQCHAIDEKLKRVVDDVGNLWELVHRQDTRLTYGNVHSSGDGDACGLGSPGESPSGKDAARRTKRNRLWAAGQQLTKTSAATPLAVEGQVETNTGRIAKLGKKLNDFECDTTETVNTLRDELHTLTQGLNMMVSFLPRRVRRLVERMLGSKEKDDAGEDPKTETHAKSGETQSKGAKVGFSDTPADVHVYRAKDDGIPWQQPGELNEKWAWCFHTWNEMGRDLACQFQQIEDEREELEKQIFQAIERLEKRRPTRDEKHHAFRHPSNGQPDSFGAESSLSPRSIRSPRGDGEGSPDARRSKAVDERIDRLAAEIQELRRRAESENKHNISREEFDLVAMRVTKLDRFDPAYEISRIDALEAETGQTTQLAAQLAERLGALEAEAAQGADVTKLRGEVGSLRTELHHLQADGKETSTLLFKSNRQVTNTIAEMKLELEKSIARVEKNMSTAGEYSHIFEKVAKLEGSMTNNRLILGAGGGGQELSAAVKRIILNIEDKIMVLEKKVDAVAKALPVQTEAMTQAFSESPFGDSATSGVQSCNAMTPAQESTVQSMGQELSTLSQALQQLKADVNVTRADVDHITEQGNHQLDLAARMNVVMSCEGNEELNTVSVKRLQVMISAAARQIVAGNKWVTKETFDARMAELRKEYLGSTRQFQANVEECAAWLSKLCGAPVTLGAAGGAAPAASGVVDSHLMRLPKVMAGDPVKQAPSLVDWSIEVGCSSVGGAHRSEGPGGSKEAAVLALRGQRDYVPPGTAPAAPGRGGGLLAKTPQPRQTPRRPVSQAQTSDRPGSRLLAQIGAV